MLISNLILSGLLFCNLCQLIAQVEGYKPVVIVHGIMDHRYSLNSLQDRIAMKHRGTQVTIVDKLHGWKSVAPLWYHVQVFKKVIEPIMEENPQGIHLIGFSQGGLVARGIIQSTPNHNIRTFVSLSSPQAGQYGDNFLKIFFPGYVKETAWRFLYTKAGQMVSVGNYWRDPHHLPRFLNRSEFLPRVDNDISTANSTEFKSNFIRLNKLVLIGGPNDGIISPWQSSHFGFYDENENVIDIRSRDLYLNDTFGLQTLDKEGKVEIITVPGVKHIEWHKNMFVIDNYILPYLD